MWKVLFSISEEVIGFYSVAIYVFLPSVLCPWVLAEMSTRKLPWGAGRGRGR
jgi:hypothetical protein